MAVEAVVFDIGNVLVEWHPEGYFDGAWGRERRERLFSEVDLHGMNLEVDGGRDMKEATEALAARHPDWAGEIRDWHDNWHQMIRPVIEPSVAMLRALKARGVPVFALTNFGADTFLRAQEMYDFLSLFDVEFVSGRLRVLKPDAAIYEAVERESGIAPGALLFTDDKAENIEAAAARGWQVHHFTGPEGLAARLVAEGLLDRAPA